MKLRMSLKETNFMSIITKFAIRNEGDDPLTKDHKDFVRRMIKENSDVLGKDAIICVEMMIGENPKGITADHKEIVKNYEDWYQGMRLNKIHEIEEQQRVIDKEKRLLKGIIGKNDPRGKGKLVLGMKAKKSTSKKKK